MCLILFAVRSDPDLPLVVAANRDEFYARPAERAHFWEDHPGVVAGRDLEAGGTWLGATKSGRFAAVTNLSEPGQDAPLSRGELVAGFLTGNTPAASYAEAIEGRLYRGYNLLLWDGAAMVYTSNLGETTVLAPGVYGLSNALLGTPWPKTVTGSARLAELVAGGPQPDALINLLGDDAVPPDELLPKRDRDIEFERRVAPCFIRGDEYGTRASTSVIVGQSTARFDEQLYGPQGQSGDRQSFNFELEP